MQVQLPLLDIGTSVMLADDYRTVTNKIVDIIKVYSCCGVICSKKQKNILRVLSLFACHISRLLRDETCYVLQEVGQPLVTTWPQRQFLVHVESARQLEQMLSRYCGISQTTNNTTNKHKTASSNLL